MTHNVSSVKDSGTNKYVVTDSECSLTSKVEDTASYGHLLVAPAEGWGPLVSSLGQLDFQIPNFFILY